MSENTMIRVRPISRFLKTQSNLRVSKGGVLLPNANGSILTDEKGRNLHSTSQNEYICQVMWTPDEVARTMLLQPGQIKDTDKVDGKDNSGMLITRTGKAPFKVGDMLIVSPNSLLGDLFEDGSLMVHVDNIIAKKGFDGSTYPLFDSIICEMHVFNTKEKETNAMKIAERVSIVLSTPVDKTWVSVSPSISEYDIIFHGHFQPFLAFDDKEYISVLYEDIMAIVGKTNKAAHDVRINEWRLKFRKGQKWNG